MSEVRRSLTVVNQRGLHARASAKFVTAVAELPDGADVCPLPVGAQQHLLRDLLGQATIGAEHSGEPQQRRQALVDELVERHRPPLSRTDSVL